MRHLHGTADGSCMPGETEPLGENVEHCNARTDYKMIVHRYAPNECDECRRCAAYFTDCPKGN
jgi:hypothetical protein